MQELTDLPGWTLFSKAQKYAEKDNAAKKSCKAKSKQESIDKCNIKAQKTSKENREKIAKLAEKELKRVIRVIKKTKDISEKDRGKAVMAASKYFDDWNKFARTGKGKMIPNYDTAGTGIVAPGAGFWLHEGKKVKIPSLKWPPY